ncbi:hypothetical protein LARV_00722 [Longilinea arvoryzae]|uniref:Uncharacterized protein n=1 Tax=Longilinea arvoryzae TaxID=360412 RepID=A0A0S7BGZ5_9CHLR|nr:hypothetical protein [Longilinea arvoryzae]GAP12981.1 hypothetical protein LARV_00722 [Longilinea arvoryzae]
MAEIEIGRLLRSGITGCVVGCRVSQLSAPAFGDLVRIPLADGLQVFGLIHDIHIDDDGLVRQLVTSDAITEEVIRDNRENRNVPVEVSVLFVGYEQAGAVSHLLPPRPPLTLDAIYPCSEAELCRFTAAGRFGYFRHVLRAAELPIGELLAAHIQKTAAAQKACGNDEWVNKASQELITLLRDDYPTLNSVLGALADCKI